MIACYMPHPRVVELLLAAGASLHAVDRKGRSPLDWARRRGDSLVIALVQEELAARGAAALHAGHAGRWLELFGVGSSSAASEATPFERKHASSAETGVLGDAVRCLLPCLPQPSAATPGNRRQLCCLPKTQP